MATNRKKLTAKSAAPRGRSATLASGKSKPAAKKAAKPARPASKTVVKAAAKAPAKALAKAKPVAKPAKPAAKAAPKTPVLNKGALRAKELAEKRAAERAAAEARRAPKLVPATPGAIRPGAKNVPVKGKAAARPAPEVRPLGVLPPESMAKSRVSSGGSRVVIPPRPTGNVAVGVRPHSTGDQRLTEDDLKHFEDLLLKERARIMREMGHFENTLLKVNPRDSAGDVGGYSFHMADAGTDSMEREISFDIASKEGRFMREIDDALRRIYNGVYGICEASGQPIPRARLEALPWARYTVQEQENIEKKQRAGRLSKDDE